MVMTRSRLRIPIAGWTGSTIYMRRICGVKEKTPAEVGVRKRILSYLNEEGLCLANPAAWTGEPVEGLWATPWGAAHILVSLGETYRDEPSDETRDLARKVFTAFVDKARKDTGRYYYPYCTPFKDGESLLSGWAEVNAYNYCWVVEPTLHYYESFGDQEGLAAAIAFAEGQLCDLPEDQGTQRIDPVTGEFTNHVHVHTRTIWGIAHLGYVTGNSRYIDWAKRAYDFVFCKGTDFGWYREQMLPGYDRLLSETCTVGDMTAIAYYLGLCGFTKCFDDIERTVVNYLSFTQFKVDKIEALFRKTHSDKAPKVAEDALAELKGLEGGFIAQTGINELITHPETLGQPGMAENGLHMMGCCPPSGMLALYYAWLASAVKCGTGEVRINTFISTENQWCKVETDYSNIPATIIRINKPAEYLFRLPGVGETRRRKDSIERKTDGSQVDRTRPCVCQHRPSRWR